MSIRLPKVRASKARASSGGPPGRAVSASAGVVRQARQARRVARLIRLSISPDAGGSRVSTAAGTAPRCRPPAGATAGAGRRWCPAGAGRDRASQDGRGGQNGGARSASWPKKTTAVRSRNGARRRVPVAHRHGWRGSGRSVGRNLTTSVAVAREAPIRPKPRRPIPPQSGRQRPVSAPRRPDKQRKDAARALPSNAPVARFPRPSRAGNCRPMRAGKSGRTPHPRGPSWGRRCSRRGGDAQHCE